MTAFLPNTASVTANMTVVLQNHHFGIINMQLAYFFMRLASEKLCKDVKQFALIREMTPIPVDFADKLTDVELTTCLEYWLHIIKVPLNEPYNGDYKMEKKFNW